MLRVLQVTRLRLDEKAVDHAPLRVGKHAEIHAKADTSTGCRTVANGVQKCDVPTGREQSREAVVAQLHGGAGYSIEGCRTVANGVQKCDVPAAFQRSSDTAVANVQPAGAIKQQ